MHNSLREPEASSFWKVALHKLLNFHKLMSAGVKMDDNRVHETLRHELTTSESAPTGTAPVTSRTRHRRSGQTYRRNRAQRATLATRATTAKAQEQSASGGTPLSLVGTSGGALGGCAETRRFRP